MAIFNMIGGGTTGNYKIETGSFTPLSDTTTKQIQTNLSTVRMVIIQATSPPGSSSDKLFSYLSPDNINGAMVSAYGFSPTNDNLHTFQSGEINVSISKKFVAGIDYEYFIIGK